MIYKGVSRGWFYLSPYIMNLLFKIFDFFVYLISIVSQFDFFVYLLLSLLVTCFIVYIVRKGLGRG